MRLFPFRRGMAVATQLPVPLASPSAPVELCQLTRTTPVLSLALPNSVIVASDVAKIVEAGQVMATLGGVVSPVGGPGVTGGVTGGVGEGLRGGAIGGGTTGVTGGTTGALRAPYKACAPAMSSDERCAPKR